MMRFCCGYLQVSATHVNTIHWHQMWQLPFKSIEADKALLDERGYALEKDMLHARSLDPDMLNLRNDYAIDSQEVAFTDFLSYTVALGKCELFETIAQKDSHLSIQHRSIQWQDANSLLDIVRLIVVLFETTM